MRSTNALYSSTPHLFVYQGTPAGHDAADDDDEDVHIPRPDYAGSTANSENSSSSIRTPEVIYYSAAELSKEQEAIRRLKYQAEDHYVSSSSNSSEASSPLAAGRPADDQQLTELELLRVETFFRGNRTQIFVGKSLANL